MNSNKHLGYPTRKNGEKNPFMECLPKVQENIAEIYNSVFHARFWQHSVGQL